MILSILKVIGIIFLVILALLILILGILLFVPIRYQFDAKYEEKPDADVLVRWSPILLKVIVNYHEGKLVYIIRMLGGVVMTNQDIPLSWIGRKFFSSSDDEEYDDATDNIQIEGKQERTDTQKQTNFVVVEDEIEMVGPEVDKNEGTTQLQKREVSSGEVQEKVLVKKRKLRQSIFKKIKRKIKAFKAKVIQIIEKLKQLNDKREALLKVYHSKRFEVAKKDAITYIKTLWMIIKPKRLEGFVHFGLNDPASTGQVLGILAMFLVWYDGFLQIVPDFEKSCVDGYLKGNGKFRLFPIVKLLIKIILNKNLIKVIKKVQTIIEA